MLKVICTEEEQRECSTGRDDVFKSICQCAESQLRNVVRSSLLHQHSDSDLGAGDLSSYFLFVLQTGQIKFK